MVLDGPVEGDAGGAVGREHKPRPPRKEKPQPHHQPSSGAVAGGDAGGRPIVILKQNRDT